VAGYHLAIISAGRPLNVPRMLAWTAGLEVPTWYVGDGEAPAYRAQGATRVVEAGALCPARNAALDAAGSGLCVQLDDDLRSLGWAGGRTRATVTPLPLGRALDLLQAALRATGARLAGIAPTANPFYARPGIQSAAFCVGDLLAIRPTSLRFDPAITLKEDYDYTLAHLARYGQVARVGQLLAGFEHRTNPGGAVARRTDALEQHAIGYLMAKWPGCLRPNPRRPNEVLLRWPAPVRAAAPPVAQRGC